MQLKDMKDPVLAWDCYRSAYWSDDGKGYTMCSRLAGIWERDQAPKGNTDRRMTLEKVPDNHTRHMADRIIELEAQLASAKHDGERLDWIERHKHPQSSWEIITDRDPTIWLCSGVRSSDPKEKQITLREKIDAARQKEGK